MRPMRIPTLPNTRTPYIRTKKYRVKLSDIIRGKRAPQTHLEKMAAQRKYRVSTGNGCTQKYEKTVGGFLVRAYRNMKSRVTGVQKNKAHLYLGLSILPRDDFYRMARGDRTFWKLWRDWVASGYSRKLTPSVNRIDPRRGYDLDNIEWLSQSENSSLGSLSGKFKEMESIRRMIDA